MTAPRKKPLNDNTVEALEEVLVTCADQMDFLLDSITKTSSETLRLRFKFKAEKLKRGIAYIQSLYIQSLLAVRQSKQDPPVDSDGW